MRKGDAKLPPGAWTWILCTGFAALVHAFCGRVAAGHDVIAALLVHRDVPVLLATAALVIARLFLFLFAPGWALHVAVKAWLLHRAERAARAP